jgi:hypothetical protein
MTLLPTLERVGVHDHVLFTGKLQVGQEHPLDKVQLDKVPIVEEAGTLEKTISTTLVLWLKEVS